MKFHLLSGIAILAACLPATGAEAISIHSPNQQLHVKAGLDDSGTFRYTATLGVGGSIVRMLASQDANKEVIPYGTSPTVFNSQWSVRGPVAFDDGDAATDDRFILNQAGTSNPSLAPVMQVEKNPLTLAVDVYSVPRDQWNPNQQAAVKTKCSSLARYEPQTDATQTTGYAVVYNSSNVSASAAMGIVFGNQPMAGANPCVVNYSDDATAISVRPGIQLANVISGSVLDSTYFLVPAYGVNAALAARLSALVAAILAPVLYPAGTTFTGELAAIVQRLNDNLALTGTRGDRLGHDVTPAPIAARPMLLNGPEDDADIRARLLAFPQTPETLLQNYLYGSAAQKQAATTYFFRYPGSGDGNGLRTNYNTITGRHMMWDQYRYDIALGLGYATQAQKDLMLSLAASFVKAKFPTYLTTDGAGGGNWPSVDR